MCRGKGGLRQLFGVRAEAVYGGVGKDMQLDSILTLGAPQVLAATPGRLLDLLGLEALSLEDVSYLVLDEADRMLALGFEAQLDALAKGIRSDRQSLLFSATFPLRLREATDRWMSKRQVVVRVSTMELGAEDADDATATPAAAGAAAPAGAPTNAPKAEVLSELPIARLKALARYHGADLQGCVEKAEIVAALRAAGAPDGGMQATPDGHGGATATEGAAEGRPPGQAVGGLTLTVSPDIKQLLHVCAEHKKPRKLVRFIDKVRAEEKKQGVRHRALMIIFCNKITTLKSVVSLLVKHQHRCAPLHSGIPQLKREKALSEFKAGRMLILVATDVASRGLHVKHLRYVINYDFPGNLEQYCHRIGRTGRDSESGTAFSFFTRNLHPMAKDLTSLLERSGAAVDPNLRALADVSGAGQQDSEDGESDEDLEEAGGDADPVAPVDPAPSDAADTAGGSCASTAAPAAAPAVAPAPTSAGPAAAAVGAGTAKPAAPAAAATAAAAGSAKAARGAPAKEAHRHAKAKAKRPRGRRGVRHEERR